MEKLIFFGLVIPILFFVLYLGTRAVMSGVSAKQANRDNKDEQEILVQMVEDQRSWYESHPEDAKKLLAVGQKLTNENLSEIDVAALSSVLAGLYAHDESVVKR